MKARLLRSLSSQKSSVGRTVFLHGIRAPFGVVGVAEQTRSCGDAFPLISSSRVAEAGTSFSPRCHPSHLRPTPNISPPNPPRPSSPRFSRSRAPRRLTTTRCSSVASTSSANGATSVRRREGPYHRNRLVIKVVNQPLRIPGALGRFSDGG